MRARILTFATLFLLSVAALSTAQSKTAADRLVEADRAKRNQGLEAAIPIYESVLGDFPNDRSSRAKAIGEIIRAHAYLGEADKVKKLCDMLTDGYANSPEVGDVRAQCSPASESRSVPGIFIAKMEPQTGAIQGTARSFTEGLNTSEGYASFSPDGRRLAFRRVIGTPNQGAVIVRSLENKTEQTMKTCGTPNAFGRQLWLPDGKSLYFAMPATNAGGCLSRNDAQTGQSLQSVSISTSLSTLFSGLSPDGTTLHTIHGMNVLGVNTAVSVALDPVTGVLSKPYTMPFNNVALAPLNTPILGISPDGRTAAHIRGATSTSPRLVLFDTDGPDRHYRELLVAGIRMQGVAWSKDGSRVLVAVSTDGMTWKIIQVSADAPGGAVTFTGLEVEGLRYFEPNRDNTQIAFDGLSSRISAPGPYTVPPATEPPAQTPVANPPARGVRGGN